MSFESVAMRIARKQKVSIKRARSILAAGTRRTMKKHGLSTRHGIPKNVFQKHGFKN